MLAWAVPLGLVVGLVLGALGAGGSILTVPALVFVLEQDPQQATTGSLLIVGVTALLSLPAHARASRVRWAEGLVFGVLGVAGAYAGARGAVLVPGAVLLGLFAVLLLVVALLMWHTRAPAGGDDTAAGARTQGHSWRRWVRVVAAATGVGLLTGFFGVGGGFVIVPALILALGLSATTAVGTSLLVIAINSGWSLLFRLGSGIVLDWELLVVFTVAAVAGAQAGALVLRHTDQHRVQQVFSGLLVLVALYTGGRALTELI